MNSNRIVLSNNTDNVGVYDTDDVAASIIALLIQPPMEYNYVERRAEILELIEQQGHPYRFDKSRLDRRDNANKLFGGHYI